MCLQSLISDPAGRGFESTSWKRSDSKSHDKPVSFPHVFLSSQGHVSRVVSPNKAFLCATSRQSHPWAPHPGCRPVCVCMVDVGTPSSFTPADLPGDERNLRPRRIIRSLHFLKTKAGPRGNLQTGRLNSLSKRPERAKTIQDQAGLQDSHYWKWEMGKVRQRCWQLWCVLRGTGWRYHSQSYARMVRWKPLPGTAVGPQPPSAQAKHTLNVQTHRHTHTHTEAQIKQILPSGSSNYPQWAGRQADTRRANYPGYHTHTYTNTHSWDSPSF